MVSDNATSSLRPLSLPFLPAAILESVARHLPWRCCLRLWFVLSAAGDSAHTLREHRLLLETLRERLHSAATILQTLARSHIAGHLLLGHTTAQKTAYLLSYLRLPTVRRRLDAGTVPPPSCGQQVVLAPARRVIRAGLLRHSAVRRLAWYYQITNGGRAWARYMWSGGRQPRWPLDQLNLLLLEVSEEACDFPEDCLDNIGDDNGENLGELIDILDASINAPA